MTASILRVCKYLPNYTAFYPRMFLSSAVVTWHWYSSKRMLRTSIYKGKLLLLLLLLLLLQLSFHSVSVVFILVQRKRIRINILERNNTKLQSTINTGSRITKTHTQFSEHPHRIILKFLLIGFFFNDSLVWKKC